MAMSDEERRSAERRRQLRSASRKLAEALAERDRLIVEAVAAGESQRSIAVDAGVSHVAVGKIAGRAVAVPA